MQYFETNNLQFLKIPLHNLLCLKVQENNEPKIIKPVNGLTYYINQKDKQELMLVAQAAIYEKMVSRYINNQFIKTEEKTKLFYCT